MRRRLVLTVPVVLATLAATALAGSAVAAPAAAGQAAAGQAAARGPVTSFSYVSDPGDFIGGGSSLSLVAPNATFQVTGSTTAVSFSVSNANHWYSAQIAAGAGDTLHPGTYVNAERASFRTGRAPGLDVYGDGRGCNTLTGSFAVNQIAFDASGALTLLDLDFSQHCEGSTPALNGTLLFNARPLRYVQKSDPGDFVGQGLTRTYTGARSLISLSGGTQGLTMSVSGLGDDWTGNFTAPTGTAFTVGKTYPVARFADATHAGLDVYGDGRGCNGTTGTLVVRQLVVRDTTVVRAVVSFVQHCEGGKPALRGTLHYYA